VSLLVPWMLIYFSSLGIETIYLIQLCVFFAVTLGTMPRSVRTLLTPKPIKRLRAHRHAIEQFLVQNLHTTAEHTGVLIFVSAAEHHVEILADTKIDAQVEAGTWKQIVDELTAALAEGRAADGLVAAIAAAGAHLSRHFPPGTRNPNELPNHLIVLE
jgi:putative membrane protein